MGAFGGFIQTNKGRNLQAKAETGTQLKFTRMGVGDGQLSGQSIPSLNRLINEKKSLPITRLKTQLPAQAIVGAVLSNQDVTTGFYFREMGIFAQDPDEGEILYAYGNSGSGAAEYISAGGTADVIEKTIDMIVTFGQAQNVSAVINSSLVYVTHEELAEALEGLDPDIPPASLTEPGIVQLSNAINSTSDAHAATPSAVKKAHDRADQAFTAGNERKAEVVAALVAIGVSASTSETWAQLIPKITAVIRATGNATVDDVIAGKTFSNANANGLIGNIPDRGAGGIVTPNTADQTKAAGRYTSAITIKGEPNLIAGNLPKDKTFFGITGLLERMTTAEKQAIANAITGKGVAASASDTNTVLAQKIGQIFTGLKIASGTLPTYQDRSITNLPFAPKVIFLHVTNETTLNDRAFAYGYTGAWLTDTNTVQYSNTLEISINNMRNNRANLSNVVFGSNYVNFEIYGTLAASNRHYVVVGV
ncbi:tail fiber protein [Priestia sp. BR_2]